MAELAERTGLVKSTILRLALSLQQFRLLARLPDGAYPLDAETLRLGTAYQRAFRLSDHDWLLACVSCSRGLARDLRD
ncbi:hypothetical protein [Bradyrhizobium genosp. P]|uniref:hypothetical protein n=1 Tax=Bradyrhizobium genosp. P TaxID=83641 RepID=UPI003CEF09C3